MTLILFHNGMSVCAVKPRIVLAEKRLNWNSHVLDLIRGDQFKQEYVRLNPKQVVPTLVHDGQPVTESNVIIQYLEEAFPDPPLASNDPYLRAQMRAWLMKLDDGEKGIHYHTSVLSFGAAYRHQLWEKAGHDPSRIESAMDGAFNPRSRRWLSDVVIQGADSPDFANSVRAVDLWLKEIEAGLANNDWLAHKAFGLVECAYASYLTRFEMLGFEGLWAPERRPKIKDWFNRIKARPSYLSGLIDWVDPTYFEVLSNRGPETWPVVKRVLNMK